MISASPIFVIAFAGLLHASFQLGVALLTLLSGHSLGSHRSFRKLMRLNIAYLFGASVITVLLFSGFAYLALLGTGQFIQLEWLVLSLLNMAIGLSVMLFYYRRSKGTGLWIPNSMAQYLNKRVKKTDHAAEAFTLGAGSVLAEIPFIVGPLSIAVLYTLSLDSSDMQALALFIYCLIALSPLVVIVALVGAGHKISNIQKWREDNKLFLQYCAGSGLIILGAFVFIDKFLGGNL
jgi:cytochrome c biogenesis protein CcdA